MLSPSKPYLLAAWHFTVLDEPARLLHPEYLLLALAVVLFGPLLLWLSWRRLVAFSSAVPRRLTLRMVPGFSMGRPLVRLGLSLGGVLVLSLGLTQPQCGAGTEVVHRAGIDLVVLLDASRSMLATDVSPNRFERAKMELTALLQELRGDRFGLVAFSGTPIVQTPLTTDRRAAAMYLRSLHPSNMPRQGTNIGAALRAARRMIVDTPGGRSRVVILISDGEDHHGDAREMARALAAEGVVIFTVGIGSVEGELIVLDEPRSGSDRIHRNRRGEAVVTRLDEELLRDIAAIGDGTYVNTRGRGVGVAEIMHAVRGMEQEEREMVEVVRYADQSVWLLFPGFLFLVLGGVLRGAANRVTKGAAASALILGISLFAPQGAEARRILRSEHPSVAEGNRAYAEERYGDAVTLYEEALDEALEPEERAIVHYNRGTALAAKGDIDMARGAFQASTALGQPRSQARDFYNLGTALLFTGDHTGARDALIESLRRDPNNRAAQHNLEIALRALAEPPPPDDAPDDDAGDEQEQDPEDGGEEQAQGDSEQEQDRDDDGEQGEGQGDEAQQDEEDSQESDEPRDEEPQPDGDRSEDAEQQDQQASPEGGADEEEQERESTEDGRPDGDEVDEGSSSRARAEPAEIGEQDVARILDALEALERPMQPFLFRPPLEIETATPDGEDW